MIDCQRDTLVTHTHAPDNLDVGDLTPQPGSTGAAAGTGVPELVGAAGAKLPTPTTR